ncbi:MAG: hypothetical protein IKS37_02440 [Solobacterium sp.]|nr:hypothetical protein [Solobacterium sp.]
MTDNRPHSRKRRDSGKTTDVNKRGNGIGGGPVGNGNYNDREKPSSGRRSNTTRNITRGGIGGSVLLLLAYMLFGGGIGGNSGTTPTPTPTAAPTPTPVVTPSSQTGGFHFGTQTTNQVTYTDASTPSVNTAVTSGSRDKYTKLLGNGQDQVTIMIYMCGTDLESKYGMATSDLSEMAQATMSDKVNIVIETGGTKKWNNNIMTPGTNQIWQLVSGGQVRQINPNLGRKAMTDPSTLSEFIQFCAKNYPANRNILIFWDHGGGSIAGYGYDELYPNGSMSVDEIASALKTGGVKFDIIGFDACLMANMETAMAVEPYGDYLLASEETEPGTGWYHTNWVSMLGKNSSTSTLDLGKQVIDDFVTVRQQGASSADKNTLSLVDLAEFRNTVPSALSAFSKKISADVKGNNYQAVADARSVTREFAQSNRLDQIDLIHFCKTLNTKESLALANALQSCVKYNKTKNINNAYGLSIYFPYRNTQKVQSIMQIYNNIGFDSDYSSAVKSFATLQASGQIVTGNSTNPFYSLFGGQPVSNGNSYGSAQDILGLLTGTSSGSSSYGFDLSSLLGGSQAVDTSSLDIISQLLGRDHIPSSSFVLTEKNGTQVLSLAADEWSKIQTVKLNVWVDDGEGYIDLGLDNIFEFDDDGDLVMDYDGMWMSLDDHVVSYYMLTDEYVDDNNYETTGYVPALVNGERVNLIVEFSDENPDGIVRGGQLVYETDIEARGLLQLQEGDTIDFLCDYYDYDGNYQETYQLGDAMTFDGEFEVADITLTDSDLYYCYELTDIYNSARWTPMLVK